MSDTLHLGTITIGALTFYVWMLEKVDGDKQLSAPFSTEDKMLRQCVDEFGVDLMNPKKIMINATSESLENLRTVYFETYTEGLLGHE